MKNQKHIELTDKIIKAYYTVYNNLGHGFLEKVYENSLAIELRIMGLKAEVQVPIKVYYNDIEVGLYFADILVNDTVILELKAIQIISPIHDAQLYNYLKATGIEVGLLLNFGLEPKVRRRTLLEKK